MRWGEDEPRAKQPYDTPKPGWASLLFVIAVIVMLIVTSYVVGH